MTDRSADIIGLAQTVLDQAEAALTKTRCAKPAAFNRADVASELLIALHTADELVGVFDPPLDPIEYHGAPRSMTQLDDEPELVLRAADGRNFRPWYAEKSATLKHEAVRLVSNWRSDLDEIRRRTSLPKAAEEIYVEDLVRNLEHVRAYAQAILDMTASHQVLIWEIRFGPESSN